MTPTIGDIRNYIGQILMEEGRDSALDALNMIVAGTGQAPDDQPLIDQIKAMSPSDRNIAERLALRMVDEAISTMLAAFDQHDELDIVVADGETRLSLKDNSDGLVGELFGANGWIKKFSRRKEYF